MCIDFLKLEPRLGRVKYIAAQSFWLSILLVFAILPRVTLDCTTQDSIFTQVLNSNPGYIIIYTLIMIFILTIIVNLIFLRIRRINDFNLKGWWILLGLVPVVNLLWEIAVLFVPGTKGANKFGKPDKAPTTIDYLIILVLPITVFILYYYGLLYETDVMVINETVIAELPQGQ
jgi:uncharacterized membrane protein YhaH (DUF805 family)